MQARMRKSLFFEIHRKKLQTKKGGKSKNTCLPERAGSALFALLAHACALWQNDAYFGDGLPLRGHPHMPANPDQP